MENALRPISLGGVGQALRRHYGKSLAVFVLTLAAVAALVVVWPREFGSEAKFYVRLGRASVRLDPTATTGQTISIHESREHEINSILEILRSRALAERVVDALGPEVVLGGDTDESAAVDIPVQTAGMESGMEAVGAGVGDAMDRLRKFKAQLDGVEPAGAREKAITLLANSVGVSAAKQSSVVTISCYADSPKLAQQMLQEVLTQFADEHMRVHQTAGSYEFFASQTKLLHGQLVEANEKLQSTKSRMGLSSISGQRQILETEVGALERAAAEAASGLEASRARVETLKAALGGTSSRVTTREQNGVANAAFDTMRQRLYDLEIKERDLLTRLKPDHPEVKQLREQVAEARKILGEQPTERTETTTDINPNHLAIQLSLSTEQSTAAGLAAQVKRIAGQRDALLARVRTLNDNELVLADLQREADRLEHDHQLYAEKMEQSRIDQALDKERISNVNVLQAPSLVSKPTSPNLPVMLAGGFLVACMSGLGVALVAESLNRTPRTPDEVEQQLDLPVMVALPRVRRSRVLMN